MEFGGIGASVHQLPGGGLALSRLVRAWGVVTI